MAGDGIDMEVRAMAMALLVGADRHLRDMGVHGAVGEHEHHVRSAGPARFPRLALEGRQVRDEGGFPHRPAPRASRALSSTPARSGMTFVSHMLRPGRTGMNSPSPLNDFCAPSRSG